MIHLLQKTNEMIWKCRLVTTGKGAAVGDEGSQPEETFDVPEKLFS